MPLYEYKCNECNKVFEVLQKMTADPLKKCIYCNGDVKKIISSTSFQFKGSGWYVTDYKDDGSKKKRSNEDSSPIKSTGTNKNATINK
ncbi:MAG: zinc ribbon domain-containing protein [Candidatus Aminicenantes bacterium]